MSTTPPRKYGYTLPALGGVGMIAKKFGSDLAYGQNDGWFKADSGHFMSNVFYCRPIDCGPGYELVGEDELMCGDWEYTTNGIAWHVWMTPSGNSTVKDVCQANNILAIKRRRKSQQSCPLGCHCERCEKAEQDSKSEPEQWPKYWFWRHNKCVYKQTTPFSNQEYWLSDSKTWMRSFSNEMDGSFEPITPSHAYELTGDPSIMSGQEHEPTCTKPDGTCDCGKPTPHWTPVAEFNLKPGEPFWELCSFDNIRCRQNGTRHQSTEDVKRWLENRQSKGWMPCEGSYQIPPAPAPKSQRELDEEWIQSQLETVHCHLNAKEGNAFRDGCEASLAYARGQKEEK